MASLEARMRRRKNREARMRWLRDKGKLRQAATVTPIAINGLDENERRTLQAACAPLFEQGIIDTRFMGIRFLELFKVGWTPEQSVRLEGRLTTRGIKCTSNQFDGIWDWWNSKSLIRRTFLRTE
jgi:hypothetical protein